MLKITQGRNEDGFINEEVLTLSNDGKWIRYFETRGEANRFISKLADMIDRAFKVIGG